MSITEQMMGLVMGRMSKEDKEAMMDSMMEKFFAGITPEEKQKMMTDMMPKMMEGMDIADMMPRMMMRMMSNGEQGQASGIRGTMGMPDMPDMMSVMMPNCIRMMMPRMEPEKRRDLAETILTSLLEAGSEGLSAEEKRAYRDALEGVLMTKV